MSDLRHFLDVDDDSPAPARRMAAQLGAIVKAATSREAGQSWVSGIACTRRPDRRPCPGRIGVHRSQVPTSVRWECIACGDEGLIHGWEGTYADLSSTTAVSDSELTRVVVSDEAADLLRTVLFVDAEVERLVYGGRLTSEGVEMDGDSELFDDLLDTLAAEANHEPNSRRRKQLDAVFSLLTDAVSTPPPAREATPPSACSVHIRSATVRDLEAVLELWQRAEAEPTHTDHLEGLMGLFDRDPAAVLIAEEAGCVVGSVIAAWDGWRGSIYRLAVAPAHRRQGVAGSLLAAAEQRLRSVGAVRLQAIVVDTSPGALGFWEASGWERQTNRARFVKG